MSDLRTNRDLYLSIEKLAKEHTPCERSLEEYLRALLLQADRFSDFEELSLKDFYDLVSKSFTSRPREFDEDWRNQYDQLPHESSGFTGWRATLIRQIVDLCEMGENGTLANEYRYFGVSSPRNSHWYNFDPLGYLECAMAGSFGSWEPGDETGRQFVSGPVTVLAEDGSIQDADPQDLPRPQFEMPVVTWDQFKHFIECGQMYE